MLHLPQCFPKILENLQSVDICDSNRLADNAHILALAHIWVDSVEDSICRLQTARKFVRSQSSHYQTVQLNHQYFLANKEISTISCTCALKQFCVFNHPRISGELPFCNQLQHSRGQSPVKMIAQTFQTFGAKKCLKVRQKLGTRKIL